jgi:DNA-directed RNA polymerase subunit H (RpoH/RPB5)
MRLIATNHNSNEMDISVCITNVSTLFQRRGYINIAGEVTTLKVGGAIFLCLTAKRRDGFTVIAYIPSKAIGKSKLQALLDSTVRDRLHRIIILPSSSIYIKQLVMTTADCEELCHVDIFTDKTRVYYVPTMERLTETNIKGLEKLYKVSRSKFPVMLTTDAMVRYLGYVAGDVIKTTSRDMERRVGYRQVVSI